MNLKPGQRVIVTFPKEELLPEARGEILDGPMARGVGLVWKVRTLDNVYADIWVPESWLRPLLRSVE